MQLGAGRQRLLGFLALCGLLGGLVPMSTSADSQALVPAWCFDLEEWKWLGYAEGVPGSASQKNFTNCLSAAAERGEIRSLKGKLLDDGLLLDAGDSSIFWPARSSSLYITAFDDRVVVKDSCDREIEVRDGRTSVSAEGYSCLGHGLIHEYERTFSNSDFTIFLVPRTFVIDGEDNWIHVGYTPESLGESYPNRWGEITLRGRHPGLWLRRDMIIWGPTGGYGRIFYHPVAGTGPEVERYRFEDWFRAVRSELVFDNPAVRVFEDAGRDLLPDREAYAQAAQGWIDAIVEDLFAGRVAPVTFAMPSYGSVWLDVAQRTVWSAVPRTTLILLELVHLFVQPDSGHGERAAATFLMLLERYAPEFDAEFARELARQYGVPVGDPLEVEPVSSRTQMVKDLLSRKAPLLPSDYEPIPPELLLSSATFEVGQLLKSSIDGLVWERPNCEVRFRDPEGNVSTSDIGVEGEFTVGAGRNWNGLEVGSSFGRTAHRLSVFGTPRTAGRVRIAVTSMCSDGQYHEPRLLGYAELIVQEPAPSE